MRSSAAIWGGALARCTSASGQTLPSSVPKLASALRRSSPKADVPLSATSRRSSASRPSRPFGPVLAGAESGRWRGLRIPRREERRLGSRGPMVGVADWNLGYGAQVWAPAMRPNPGGGGRRSSGSPPYLGSLVSALSQSDSRCWRTARSKPVHEHSRYQLHPARSRPSGRQGLRYGQGARDVAPEHARLGYAAREPGLFALPQRLSRRNERLRRGARLRPHPCPPLPFRGSGPADCVPLRHRYGRPGLKTERWPSLNQKAIDLGSEYGPLADARVRQAIALGVDKDEVMRASIGGLGQVIGTMVAAMQERWGLPLAEVPNQKADVESAKKLLAEAGHANGLELNLTTIIGYDWMDPAAVTMREQLARIGVKLNIQRVELGVWIKNFQSKQMGFTFNDWATQPDPNLLFYRHFRMAPEGADFRNWKNEKASRLLDEGRAENDPAKRKAIYLEFQKEMARSVPTIMLFSADLVTVRSEKVRNYVQHPTGWYYGLARTFVAQ